MIQKINFRGLNLIIMITIDELKNIESYSDKLLGYVYVINNGNNIKIGCTSNLYQRIKSLSNSNSGGNVILDIYYSPANAIYKTIERLMHEKFHKYNTTGEWYTDIDFITVCNYLDQLCTSESFARCDKERRLFNQKHKYIFNQKYEYINNLENIANKKY